MLTIWKCYQLNLLFYFVKWNWLWLDTKLGVGKTANPEGDSDYSEGRLESGSLDWLLVFPALYHLVLEVVARAVHLARGKKLTLTTHLTQTVKLNGNILNKHAATSSCSLINCTHTHNHHTHRLLFQVVQYKSYKTIQTSQIEQSKRFDSLKFN